jgi:hypothetical protein
MTNLQIGSTYSMDTLNKGIIYSTPREGDRSDCKISSRYSEQHII